MNDPITVNMMEESNAPKMKNMMGEKNIHPEFCPTSCDGERCNNSGYAASTALDVAANEDRPVQCKECGCEHDEWKEDTVEILSTHERGAEIEAECKCGKTLYSEVLAEEIDLL